MALRGEPSAAIASITSVRNLRDVGGKPTRGGGAVRTGLLYRSGALDGLGGADLEAFAGLGIRSVYDLRGPQERGMAPDRLPPGTAYLAGDVLGDWAEGSPDRVFALFADPAAARLALGGGRAEALWTEQYRKLVTLPSARAMYGRLFRDVGRAANRPALVHCSGGKDRSGWAAAALLLLLDVDRDVVVADFMASGWHEDEAASAMMRALAERGGDPELWRPVFTARPGHLEAALEQVAVSFGSIEAYFADGLGVDGATQEVLRTAFVG